jgi:hypothetical protein
VFSIDRRLPKLNVAGSIPVSRSIKSTVYRYRLQSVLHLCSDYIARRPLQLVLLSVADILVISTLAAFGIAMTPL